MTVLTFNIHGAGGGQPGAAPRAMKLDLDPALPNEKTILEFVTIGRYYEPDIARVMLQVLRDGDTVIDVGANIGFFSILAATMVGPAGRVVSVEPDPANRARLEANFALNGYGNATVIGNPASDKAGPVAFYINSDHSGGNALWDPARFPGNAGSAAAQKVSTLDAVTLDAEAKRLKLAKPKLIKVDTEGADQKVLQGAKKLLAKAGVPFVIAELHEFGLAQLGCSQASFRGYMESLGYSAFALYFNGAMPRLIPPGTKIHTKIFVNLLFSTAEAIGRYWPDFFADPATN